MIGYIVGAAALVGLARVSMHGGHCHGHGCGGRWGRGFHGPGRGRGRLRFLFERLETSPSQEEVILGAVDALRERGRKLREEVAPSRRALAEALRAERFETGGFQETLAHHEAQFRELREAFVGELGKVHAVLDGRQRRELAELLERGFRRPGCW